MEYRVPGPLEVVHEGEAVALPGSREQVVLALLLLSANRVCRRSGPYDPHLYRGR